jgi:hypothetical protein
VTPGQFFRSMLALEREASVCGPVVRDGAERLVEFNEDLYRDSKKRRTQ